MKHVLCLHAPLWEGSVSLHLLQVCDELAVLAVHNEAAKPDQLADQVDRLLACSRGAPDPVGLILLDVTIFADRTYEQSDALVEEVVRQAGRIPVVLLWDYQQPGMYDDRKWISRDQGLVYYMYEIVHLPTLLELL